MPTESSSNRGLLITIIVLLSIIVLAGTFFLGSHAGRFRCQRESFQHLRRAGFPKDMIEGRPGFFGMGPGMGPMRGGHGIAGEVLKKEGNTITILGRDEAEHTIVIGSGTMIGPRGSEQTIDEITVGSRIIGFGRPQEDGSLEMRHVMVVPAE